VLVKTDDLVFRANTPQYSSDSVRHLRTYIVNCWTKLDEYFAIVDETPAHYASVVTTPHMKWKYFQHTWKDAPTWKDATGAATSISVGRKSLDSRYQTLRW
jgi:hypothetical protein